MSLTNPDKIVTEERLNEYHNTILPYLGGMPDILANKFSKGDMYSTDEKMIGQWIDGKPIYQKCCELNNITVSHTTWTDTGITMANISAVINCKMYSTSGAAFNAECVYENNNFKIEASRYDGDTANIYLITLQYTKTTDSAVAIGNDTDYSTTEKIVGTWIDGEPVYQKTLVGSATGTNSQWVNIGTLTTLLPHYTNNSKIIRYDFVVTYNNATSDGATTFDYVNNKIEVKQSLTTGNITYNYILNVQYT